MAVDVGRARVGLATCDPDGILATPLKTLKRNANTNSDRRVLRKLVEVHEVREIFVGHPKTMRGGSSDSTHMAEEYAEALADELAEEGHGDIPVWLLDERLTTASARRSLHAAGVSSRDFKTMVDQMAAVEILQRAIDALTADRLPAGYCINPEPRVASNESTTDAVEKNGDHS